MTHAFPFLSKIGDHRSRYGNRNVHFVKAIHELLLRKYRSEVEMPNHEGEYYSNFLILNDRIKKITDFTLGRGNSPLRLSIIDY